MDRTLLNKAIVVNDVMNKLQLYVHLDLKQLRNPVDGKTKYAHCKFNQH